jgi:hypothetical protein
MKGIFTFTTAVFCFLITAFSQTPSQILTNWAAKSPLEKIYLHTDREDYVAGEMVWFKAYLYAENIPDTMSTVLYTELYNEDQKLVTRVVLPIFAGDSFGDITIPDSSLSGDYFLRAYTPAMLNHDADFIFSKKIRVTGKGKYNPRQSEKKQRIEFFPEGGNLVSGLSNTVAFKITGPSGFPENKKGVIRNQNGDSILAFESYHDGMGLFEIESKPGISYYAQLNGDGNAEKFYLPAPVEKGVVFNLLPDPQGIYYSLKQKKSEPDFEGAYMIGQMDHHIVFEKQFKSKEEWVTGVINTAGSYSGIMQITVFNKMNMPLAERLWFVDNGEYKLKGTIKADTLNFNKRGFNKISFSIPDTVLGSFSVSVTDADLAAQDYSTENIYSGLLLTSDLKGYVHNPAYYFSSNSDSVKTALDLLMMTNGWRRFKWNDLLTGKTVPVVYKDPTYITLQGQINSRDSKKTVPDKELLVIISTPGGLGNSTQIIKTDAAGRYSLDSMVFYGPAKILFSDFKGRKSKWIDVINQSDSISKKYLIPQFNNELFPSVSKQPLSIADRLNKIYATSQSAFDRTLEEVVVTTRKKSSLELLDERYTSSMFSGDAMKTLDLVNTDDAGSYPSIFEYIEANVPGVTVARDGFDYTIYYRQAVTLSSRGPVPMTIFLNEMQTDISFVSSIPVSEIAMVKIYNSFVAVSGNAPGGVLAIYTKKGADLMKSMPSAADVIMYSGFSYTREFYSPDYSVDSLSKSVQNDNRITLRWKPDIYLKNINPVVPIRFYNNDFTRRFKITVQGMTKDGKMLFLEKIYANTPPKGF